MLWEAGKLGDSSPSSLLHTMWFLNVQHFVQGSGKKLTNHSGRKTHGHTPTKELTSYEPGDQREFQKMLNVLAVSNTRSNIEGLKGPIQSQLTPFLRRQPPNPSNSGNVFNNCSVTINYLIQQLKGNEITIFMKDLLPSNIVQVIFYVWMFEKYVVSLLFLFFDVVFIEFLSVTKLYETIVVLRVLIAFHIIELLIYFWKPCFG